MFTAYTWQDWQATPDWQRPAMLEKIISTYKASADFTGALEALQYFRGENPTVAQKVILRKGRYNVVTRDAEGRKITKTITREQAIVGARLPASFLFRFITQQNQFLLANGVTLADGEQKARLGLDFDRTLEQLGEMALIAGVSWGFWNADHLEAISAARDAYSGFVALLDEETSAPMLGVQFWQLAPRRPLHIRLFEVDGLTVYRKDKGSLTVMQEKRPYVLTVTRDVMGPVEISTRNYGMLPVFPLYANSEMRSELTQAIKAKIDAYDRITSDFVDNLDKANDVYWVLNNWGGTLTDMQEMLESIRQTGIVANQSDGTGSSSTAQPHAFEVPYNARQTALTILEKELYKDYMAVNMDELTGGSLTNVAIQTAMTNLNLKCDRYEWQVFRFVQQVLSLLGIKTEQITFKRQNIVNASEVVEDIAVMRNDLDDETALKLNPYINQEDIEEILRNRDAKVLTGLSGTAAANAARGLGDG